VPPNSFVPDPYSRRYDEGIADELRRARGDEHVVEVSVHAGGGRPTWHVRGINIYSLPRPT